MITWWKRGTRLSHHLIKNEEEHKERAIKVKSVRKPDQPTEKEIEEHMVTHTPYRPCAPIVWQVTARVGIT